VIRDQTYKIGIHSPGIRNHNPGTGIVKGPLNGQTSFFFGSRIEIFNSFKVRDQNSVSLKKKTLEPVNIHVVRTKVDFK